MLKMHFPKLTLARNVDNPPLPAYIVYDEDWPPVRGQLVGVTFMRVITLVIVDAQGAIIQTITGRGSGEWSGAIEAIGEARKKVDRAMRHAHEIALSQLDAQLNEKLSSSKR